MNLASYTRVDYQDIIDSLPSTGCEIEVLGKDSSGVNDIYGVWYGDITSKPVYYIVACIHGSEWRATHYALDFMTRIANPDETEEPYIAELRNTFAFYCIVCASPSGYINSTYTNANGVNLNRNYDNNWDSYPIGEGTVQYKGASPFSEPETRIVRDKMLALKPFVAADLHTTGELGGMGNGAYSRKVWALILGAYKATNASFNKADLPVQGWNSGAAPTFVGWGKNQLSKKRYKYDCFRSRAINYVNQ